MILYAPLLGRAWLGERESWGADLVRNQVNPLGRHSVALGRDSGGRTQLALDELNEGRPPGEQRRER